MCVFVCKAVQDSIRGNVPFIPLFSVMSLTVSSNSAPDHCSQLGKKA